MSRGEPWRLKLDENDPESATSMLCLLNKEVLKIGADSESAAQEKDVGSTVRSDEASKGLLLSTTAVLMQVTTSLLLDLGSGRRSIFSRRTTKTRLTTTAPLEAVTRRNTATKSLSPEVLSLPRTGG